MSPANGLITHPSPYTVPETLDRLEAILRAKAITIFARIDHSGKAAKVGLTMPPTQLLIFGNPRGGTPIMLAAPLSPQSISLSRPSPGRTHKAKCGSVSTTLTTCKAVTTSATKSSNRLLASKHLSNRPLPDIRLGKSSSEDGAPDSNAKVRCGVPA